jgi:hypothetical protein
LVRNSKAAARIWTEARPAAGSLVETYLADERGIPGLLSTALRFHPACLGGPDGRPAAAMIALVEGAAAPAIHRTFLTPDGRKLSGPAAKKMLGPVAGGAVRLFGATGPGTRLVVAEGIETALSLTELFRLGAAAQLADTPSALWAALSAGGMAGLRLPAEPASLVIGVDGDVIGQRAALALATRAAATGWEVRLVHAAPGVDFNDMLLATRTEGRP